MHSETQASATAQDPSAARRERIRFLALLLAVTAASLTICWPAFQGRIYTHDDLRKYHIPGRHYHADCLARGEAPDWCPYLFCGFDLHGEGQFGFYHPLIHLNYRLLPLELAYQLEFFLRYVLLLAGMYFLFRLWGLPQDACLLGSLTFAFGSFTLVRLIHVGPINVLAHLPWLLLCSDILLCSTQARARVWAWLGLALCTASEMLVGYPPALWYNLQIQVFYLIVLFFVRRARWQSLGLWVFAIVLGVLGGMVQLLPTWELARFSLRDAPPTDSWLYEHYLRPRDLLQLVSPYHLLWGSSTFHEVALSCGAPAAVLCLWGILRAPNRGKYRGLAVAAGVLFALSFLVALGPATGLFSLLTHLPIVGRFRNPSRYIVCIQFALAILVAVGSAEWVNGSFRPGWRFRLALCAPAAISGFVFFRDWSVRSQRTAFGLFTDVSGQAFCCLLLLIVTAASFLRPRLRAWALPLVGALLLADQTIYGLSYVRRSPVVTWQEFRDSLPVPPDADGNRAHVLDSENCCLVTRTFASSGYTALWPKHYLNFDDRRRLTLAGVRWRFRGNLWEGVIRGPAAWEELPSPLPYARLVSDIVVTDDPTALLHEIDPRGSAIVFKPLDISPGEPGKVDVQQRAAGLLKAHAHLASSQLLVVSESYHSGWKVTVNGVPQEVLRVNGDHIGCVLPKGDSAVTFEFSSDYLRVGRWLSLLAVTAILATTIGLTWCSSRFPKGAADDVSSP